jgi:hypothetical protein|tara:strand:- start:21742 stop:22038 length:297 start_codon:yes stop_codon:yes gene_type:complete
MLESKWFGALFTLIINMGSGYVLGDVQRLVSGVFSLKLMKWFVVFAILFASTQDFVVALCTSILFAVIVWGLCDVKSEVSLLRVRKILRKKLLDIDES